jgi:surface protein
MTTLSWKDNNTDEIQHEVYISTGNIPDNLTNSTLHFLKTGDTSTTDIETIPEEQSFDTISVSTVITERYYYFTSTTDQTIYFNRVTSGTTTQILSHPYSTNDKVYLTSNSIDGFYFVNRVNDTQFKLATQINGTSFLNVNSLINITFRLVEPFINYRIAAVRGTGTNREVALSSYWPMFNPNTTDAPRFKFKVKTSANKQTFTLPLLPDQAYKIAVDWGDNTRSYYNKLSTEPLPIFNGHVYETSGVYTITIVGKLNGFSFNNSSSAVMLEEIVSWGQMTFNVGATAGVGGYFYGCSNLTNLPTLAAADRFEGTTNNLNFNNFFRGCSKLFPSTTTAFNSIITSRVTSTQRMFQDCSVFNLSLSTCETTNVTDMSYMFYGCSAFNKNINTNGSNWSTQKVTNMAGMFWGAHSFNQSLNDWNVSSVTNMSSMFRSLGVTEVTYNDQQGYVRFTLPGTAHSFNGNISSWIVSNVSNMSYMFYGCTSFNQDITSWNTSALTNSSYMFVLASSFNRALTTVTQGSTRWVMGNVTTMAYMFNEAAAFQGDGVHTWNIAALTLNGAIEMFDDSGLTTANYNLILGTNNWPSKVVSNQVVLFSAGTAVASPLSNKDALLAQGWLIKDGSTSGEYKNSQT